MCRIKWLSLILFVAGLSACATNKPTQLPTTATGSAITKVDWKERQAALSRLKRWQLSGKIAVQSPNDSGSATVDWSQQGNRYVVSLLGPLGTHGLKLMGQPGHVTMQTAEGKQASASTPEELLRKQWGFNLPVSNLLYWVRGLPAPNTPADTHFDEYHRLASLSQQGWHVQFVSYTNQGALALPDKIFMTSPSLKTKMIIYHWNVGRG